MPRPIIVSGASGAGKTFLLQHVNRLYGASVKSIQKLTTRPNRVTEPKNESLDLIFSCSDGEVQSCDYIYHYCDHNYGIKKTDIDIVLAKEISPIVIVADCAAIDSIKNDYENALVLFVQSVLSGDDLRGKPPALLVRLEKAMPCSA